MRRQRRGVPHLLGGGELDGIWIPGTEEEETCWGALTNISLVMFYTDIAHSYSQHPLFIGIASDLTKLTHNFAIFGAELGLYAGCCLMLPANLSLYIVLPYDANWSSVGVYAYFIWPDDNCRMLRMGLAAQHYIVHNCISDLRTLGEQLAEPHK